MVLTVCNLICPVPIDCGMPDVIPEGLPESIHQSLQEKHLGMSALSGTYNMIHPDHSKTTGIGKSWCIDPSC